MFSADNPCSETMRRQILRIASLDVTAVLIGLAP